MNRRHSLLVVLLAAGALASCSAWQNPKLQAQAALKAQVATQLVVLHQQAVALYAAAPTPGPNGWNATTASSQLQSMKDIWRQARDAYERNENTLEDIFPDIDHDINGRYEDAIAQSGVVTDLFSGDQFSGMHAIERILWSNSVSTEALQFESTLPGYQPPSFPSNQQESSEFVTGLLARFESDTQNQIERWAAGSESTGVALDRLTDSAGVPSVFLYLDATQQQEDRYSQETLADMRANIIGAQACFDTFSIWLNAKGWPDLQASVDADYQTELTVADKFPGMQVPPAPEGWNGADPTPLDLRTPYGQLYTAMNAPNLGGDLGTVAGVLFPVPTGSTEDTDDD